MILLLARGHYRLDDVERQAKPPGELGAGQLACEVQRLENQLGDQVAARARPASSDFGAGSPSDACRSAVIIIPAPPLARPDAPARIAGARWSTRVVPPPPGRTPAAASA